jgi:hypothetical protein
VSPNPVSPGGTLTISGTNLGSASSVTVSGATAAIQSNSAASIVVVVSAAQPLGAGQNVAVTTPGGTHNSATVEVVATPVPPPVVSGVSPNPVNPGALLVISGTNLGNASSVVIAGNAAAIQSNSASQIVVAVSPTQPTGTGQAVVVTTPGGTHGSVTVAVLLPPTVTSVSPNPIQPGELLTITGTALDNAISVTVGGTPAQIESNTATEIKARVSQTQPQGPNQTVEVTTPAGSDNTAAVTVEIPPPPPGGALPNGGNGCATLSGGAWTLLILLLGPLVSRWRTAHRAVRGYSTYRVPARASVPRLPS